ncbi:MAG: DUF4416 family protein [Spirochaetota bacterium]
MAEPVIPQKAKLFIGFIYGDDLTLQRAVERCEKKFGTIDMRSMPIQFSHTEYYRSMGPNLKKTFISFEKLITRESIVGTKLWTNKLEKNLSGKADRTINIDPGYLTLSNVYLASCKEYFHRAYLTRGVYLENEYKYIDRRYRFWDWTYPDYQKKEYLEFFHSIRSIYYSQIKKYL